ncbi:MAG: PolyA polymerase, partial [Candidatus Azambacteria bacterium GW2011_GWE1_42_9]
RRSLGEGGLGIKPKDWDVATNAKPEEIQKVFPKSFYENKFLTVTVQTGSKDSSTKEVEITTYRSESKYTDKRHPDEVKFAKNIQEDLARRDFTINAIAYDGKKFIDFFDGQKDIKNKLIRTVGNPDKRFNEDALRLLRAIRFAVQLNFAIEPETAKAIKKNANDLVAISKERIRDELIKIIMTENAKPGIEMLREFGLLKHILPEVEEGFAVGQNKHHIYTVWEHNLLALDWAVKHNYKLENRLASLLHDVGKPKTKRGDGLDSTFYNHEVVGAKMTAKILERLKFPKKFIEKVVLLVRYHLFYYNVEEVSESSVRRLVKNVGPENMDDLLEVRIADRKGSGVPKAEPYKLRHLRAIIEKVSRDPISVKMLKINGDDLMAMLKVDPGPKIGFILNILLDEILDDPEKNGKKYLSEQAKKLNGESLAKLEKMFKMAQDKTREAAEEEFKGIKSKFRV